MNLKTPNEEETKMKKTKLEEVIQGRNEDFLIQFDERRLQDLKEEEIESLLQEMTKQGLLKREGNGYSLTTKGKIKGRMLQAQDFFQ